MNLLIEDNNISFSMPSSITRTSISTTTRSRTHLTPCFRLIIIINRVRARCITRFRSHTIADTSSRSRPTPNLNANCSYNAPTWVKARIRFHQGFQTTRYYNNERGLIKRTRKLKEYILLF